MNKKGLCVLVVGVLLFSLGAVPAFQGSYVEASNGQISAMSIDSTRFPDMVLVHVSLDIPYVLTETAFEIYEDGKKQQITDFDYTNGRNFVAPVDLVFIIDRSGSMGDDINDIRDNAYKLAKDLKNSGVNARFALVTFGLNPDDARIDLPFTDDVSKLKQALDSIVINGGIEWSFDGIMEAFKLNFRPTAQKVFIVVTDEDDQSQSKYTVEEVANKVKSEGVFLVLVYNHNDGYRLSQLSQAVGALDMDILEARQQGFGEVLQRITTTIGQQYHIGYSPTNKNMDGSEREVKVVVRLPDGSTLEATGSYVAPVEKKKKYEPTPDENVVYDVLKEINKWFTTTEVHCDYSLARELFKNTWEKSDHPFVPNLDLHTMSSLDSGELLEESGCTPPAPPSGGIITKKNLGKFLEYFKNFKGDTVELNDITITKLSPTKFLVKDSDAEFYIELRKYSANIFTSNKPQRLILNYVDRYFISTLADSQTEFRDYKRFVQRLSFRPEIYADIGAELGLPSPLDKILDINLEGGYQATGKLKEGNPNRISIGELNGRIPEPEAALYGSINFEAKLPGVGESEISIEAGSEAENTLFRGEMIPLAVTYLGTVASCAVPSAPSWLCGISLPVFLGTAKTINDSDLSVYVEIKGTKAHQPPWVSLGPVTPPSIFAFSSIKFFVELGDIPKPGVSVSAGWGTQIGLKFPLPSIPILKGKAEFGAKFPLTFELVDPPTVNSSIIKVSYAGDNPKDSDMNGQYDSLALLFNVTANTGGKYLIIASLSTNSSVATAFQSHVTLREGTNVIDVSIPAQYIYYTNHTGSFDVGLIIQDENGSLVYYNFTLGKTKNYDYRNFEHVIPKFDLKYAPLDIDNDGKYDMVQVNITELNNITGLTLSPMLTAPGWIVYLNSTNLSNVSKYTMYIDGMHVRKLMGNFSLVLNVANMTSGVYLGSYKWNLNLNPSSFESNYPTIESAVPVTFNYNPAVTFTVNVPEKTNILITTDYEVGGTTYQAVGYFENVTPGIHNLTVLLDPSVFVMHNTKNAKILSATLMSNELTTDSIVVNKESSFFLLPRAKIWNITQTVNVTTKTLNTSVEVMSYENTNATVAVILSSGNVTLAEFAYPEMNRGVIMEIPVVFDLSRVVSNLSREGVLTVFVYNREGELLTMKEVSVDLSALLPTPTQSTKEESTYTNILALSWTWTKWFFNYYDEFNETYANATALGIDNETLQKALELHNNATALIKDAWRTDDLEQIRTKLWRGDIIPKLWEVRLAYLKEKEAIELLKNAMKNDQT